MKTTTHLSAYILAMAGPASILADQATVWVQASTMVTVTMQPGDSAPVPAAATPISNPPASSSSSSADSSAGSSAPASGGGALSSSNGQICINFSGNDNFHWLNTGTWGSKSGQGAASASQCFDPSANAGMFICENECSNAGDAALAAYTKLECTLGGQWQNCDISLVDGYSLPLQCTIPGAAPEKIGGTVDLESLTSCPTTSGDNTCRNANAYMSDKTDVTEYFQNANGGSGGNYCVYQYCSASSDSFFSGTPTIECVVGNRTQTASSKRDVEAPPAKRDGASRSGHRHGHQHAHARGLEDVAA